MDSDRELLEWAAKAAGLTIARWVDGVPQLASDTHQLGKVWNPLRSALDAHDLACKFGMVVDCEKMTAGKPGGKKYMWLDESMSNVELVCRSITMAAAEIGKAIK